MPPYEFLSDTPLDYSEIADEMKVQPITGVPYTDDRSPTPRTICEAQANRDATGVDALQKRYPKAQVARLRRRPEDGSPRPTR